MKTVPTVRLADTTDDAEDVRLAMTDIAGAAREGLLAMSVAAGMAVMAAMLRPRSLGCPSVGQAQPRPAPYATAPGRDLGTATIAAMVASSVG